jgi:hypothetical protein
MGMFKSLASWMSLETSEAAWTTSRASARLRAEVRSSGMAATPAVPAPGELLLLRGHSIWAATAR